VNACEEIDPAMQAAVLPREDERMRRTELAIADELTEAGRWIEFRSAPQASC